MSFGADKGAFGRLCCVLAMLCRIEFYRRSEQIALPYGKDKAEKMSRRDRRKAMELRLPDDLRLRLVATTDQHLPLAYLARQALRQAFEQGRGWETAIQPGASRPILLQLTTEEQAQLARWADQADSLEIAILSLISSVV